MSDIAAMLDVARQALHQLHHGAPLQIKQAEAELNRISSSLNPQSAITLADRLLHPQPPSSGPPSPAETVHAFHLLEQRVLPSFTDLPQPFRLQVRRFALLLVSPNPLYSSLHTNKAVSFLAALAVREWPQRYSNFIDDVIAMPAHIGCQILTHISDDIYAFHSSIHSKRLQELRHAMALTLSTTLPFITSAADNFHKTANWNALLSAVQCLRSFLPWASLKILFSMRVPHACFMLICNPRDDVRNEVLNALLCFVGRIFPGAIVSDGDFNPSTAFREVFFGLLNVLGQTPLVLAPLSRSLVPPTDAFPPLKEAWFKSTPLKSVGADAHEFTVKFFEVLSKLGITHFSPSFLCRKCHSSKEPDLSNNDRELAAAFVDLMSAALTCPSYVLRDTVFSFFATTTSYIIKKEIRSELALFLVTRFLYASTAGVLKFATHSDVDLYKEIDFEGDDVSFRVARRRLNGLMYGTLRNVSQILPEESALFILSRLMRLLSQPVPDPKHGFRNGPREANLVCPDSDGQSWNFGDFRVDRRAWRHCIDTTYPTVDAICQIASDKVSAEVKTQMIAFQRQAFEVVVAWNDVDLLISKIHVLRVLFLLYLAEPPKLDACIGAFGSLIDNPITPSTVRSRACVSLRSVYRRLRRSTDARIGRFANILCDYAVTSLLNSKFREQDKMQLVEASVSCIMSIPDVKQAEQKIERMLMPLVNTLSSANALAVYQSPTSFLDFLMSGHVDEVSPLVCAFNVLSSSMQQISRPAAKGAKVNLAAGILSHAIAPKAVEVARVFLPTLHGFFNAAKFPRDKSDKLRYNVLLPTCKYLVYLVNLDSNEILRRVADEHDSYEEKPRAFREGPSVQEERSYDILCSYGIDPPDCQYAWIRETLHNLRISGYEIIRACVLSGVTKSPTHLNTILQAFCADFKSVEPFHLLGIMSRILDPLLSFSLVSKDPSFLESIARSEVPKLLRHIGDHIDASIKGAETFSDTSALDIYRDCCRSWLRRTAMSLISGMYPGPNQLEEYFPPQFQVPILGDALYSLWIAGCNPGKDANDKSSFQFPFDAITRAAAISPCAHFQFFGPLLEASFRAAVLNVGETSSTADAPVRAMLTIIRKWPIESGRQLHTALGQNDVLQQWVTECIQQMVNADQAKPKKQKSLLRDLVRRVADHEGTAFIKEKKVKVLPEKLVAINTKRNAKRARGDLDELELGEGALDSLFGEGDPL